MLFALQCQSVSSKFLRIHGSTGKYPEPIPKRGISHLLILSLSGYFLLHKRGMRRQNPQKTARKITVNLSIDLEKGAIKKPPRRAAYLHGPAGIGALFTFGSAFLAMVVFEFCTACRTLVANCRA
jgi:hypothetical protein